MPLAYFIYTFLLVMLYISISHNDKLLATSYNKGGAEIKNYNIWKWPLIFVFSILVLIIGLRYDVGVDFIGYKYDYEGVHKGFGQWERYEFGYRLIIYTLSFLGFGSWALFTVMAFITWYYFIQSFKVFPFLLKWGFFFALTTGFLFTSMNGMRQTVALVIFMYGLKYIEEKSIFKYTLYSILALSFHTSILLVYPFYFFINKFYFTKKIWLVVYTLTYVIGDKVNLKELVIYGANLIPKYAHYTHNFLENFEEPLIAGFGSFYFFLVGFLVISLSEIILQKEPRLKIYYNLYFIGAIIYNFLWKYAILGRIYYLFIWFEIFCLAAIAYYLGKSRYTPLLYLLIITQILFFVYKIYKGENQCSPFQFI